MVKRLHKSYLIMLLSSDTPHTKIHGKSSVRFLFERVDLNFYPFSFFDYFRFDSVFIKKIIKLNFFLKKPKPIQTNRFQFGSVRFFRIKTSLARFFRFGSVFFPVFFFGLGLVRFFWFQAYKTETEPNRSVFSKFYSV